MVRRDPTNKPGALRGPTPKTVMRVHRIYAEISKFLREKGYVPTYREICQIADVPSTSQVHYYLGVLQDMGLVELAKGGRSRAFRIIGTVVQPPAGLLGRSGAEYTYEELEKALSDTRDALLSMYEGMGRKVHWRRRTMHPVEVANLAREVSQRFVYDFEKTPEEFSARERAGVK